MLRFIENFKIACYSFVQLIFFANSMFVNSVGKQ